ncbi:MAG TPA: GNAT family N-acetyltransferase, partial [Opitutae bacterium]|nr:GNAT family N-acetyltransferase [Opitutae bacterium]
HRMSGIARSLFLEAQDAARANGARTLYVSATPTDAAVGFYLHQGFQPTTDPVPALLEKEPENIHMVKRL